MERSQYWSIEGLKALGRLIDEKLVEVGQNQLGREVGTSPRTLSNLAKNRHASDWDALIEPKVGTLMYLGGHLSDPRTGRAFTGDQLIQIARGRLIVEFEESDAPTALSGFLQRQIQALGLTPDSFRLEPERLEQILGGDLNLNFLELNKIARATHADVLAIVELCGVDLPVEDETSDRNGFEGFNHSA